MKEIWKPIPGCFGYEASNLGRIRSIDRVVRKADKSKKIYRKFPGVLLKPHLNQGYHIVTISNKKYKYKKRVHRLVFSAFNQKNINNLTINHKNLDKIDNRIENLEACTLAENTRHALSHFVRKKNSDGSAPLSLEEVKTIRFFYNKSGKIKKILSKIFNKSTDTIMKVGTKKSHKHVI